MKYESQRVAWWFFATCMLLFSLQIVYGFIMAFAHAGYDAAYLERWLHDPQRVKPGTAMPRLPLSEPQVRELVAFLSQLRPEVRP